MSGKRFGGILTGVLIAAVLMTIVLYNGLAGARETVMTRESDIATQLQRRGDLIPNLVKVVKRFTEHESAIIEKVTAARAKLAGARTLAEKGQADAELRTVLQRLMVIVENYPQLKSDTVYVGLMDELSGTENRIAVARKNYNEAVRAYNLRLVGFPSAMVGNLFGFVRADYFEANPASVAVPNVELGL